MRVAAVAGHGVDRLDLLRAELEQHLRRHRDDLVLADARAQHPVDLLVDGVDDRRGVVQQRDLVGGLDAPAPASSPAARRRSRCPAAGASRASPCPSCRSRAARPRSRARGARGGCARPGASGMPVSRGIAPRIEVTPACQLDSGSHGAYSWWCLAAEPKSHRIGSPSRGRSTQRALLSRAHSPMCVLVTYRMLFWSKRSSAPSSESPKRRLGLSSRSLRSRAKSMRCSQSTAIVAPREAMFMSGLLPSLVHLETARHGRHADPLFIHDKQRVQQPASHHRRDHTTESSSSPSGCATARGRKALND